jgi:hypothetical protein
MRNQPQSWPEMERERLQDLDVERRLAEIAAGDTRDPNEDVQA